MTDVTPFAAAFARAVTGPTESMMATDPLVEAHENVTPVITASSVSCATARYERVIPRAAIVNTSDAEKPAESRMTAIRVIGVSTLTLATPVTAPAVARICVAPSPSAETRPAVSTVATAGAVDDQVKDVTPAIGLPSPSTAFAVKGKLRVR